MDFCKEVMKIMRQNRLYFEAWSEAKNIVAVEVIWGDWKHDHARLNWLVTKSLNVKKIGEKLTDEDGSDTYSSIHKFYF